MIDWLKQMFSENTKASFGRLGSFLALLLTGTWITRLIWKLPDYGQLSNLAIFLGACVAFISALYGISKAGDTWTVLKKIDAKSALDAAAAPEVK